MSMKFCMGNCLLTKIKRHVRKTSLRTLCQKQKNGIRALRVRIGIANMVRLFGIIENQRIMYVLIVVIIIHQSIYIVPHQIIFAVTIVEPLTEDN